VSAKPTTRSRSVKRPAAKPATRRAPRATAAKGAGKRVASKPAAGKRVAGKGAAGKRVATKPARGKAVTARRTAPRKPAAARRSPASRWIKFVAQHGVVLASARGPVPCIAEAVAGQPIVGSWWAHPKGRAIFAALSELDDSDDVRCFKLVDRKVTFVHRRVWPALARLAASGAIDAARAAAIQQEHMPTGEHRNLVTPYPDWVPDDVARAAAELTVEAARAQLGPWL
jgi:hypothetical protein